MENSYEQAKEFHNVFHPTEVDRPTAFSGEEAFHRASFTIEELVEFVYAATDNDQEAFENYIEKMKESVDTAARKITNKQQPVKNPLVEEVDALIDTLYFTYGSFALMDVDPTSIFPIVHQANMQKRFPDGQVHYHPETGKVLKPDNWEEDCAPEAKIANELQRQLEEKKK